MHVEKVSVPHLAAKHYGFDYILPHTMCALFIFFFTAFAFCIVGGILNYSLKLLDKKNVFSLYLSLSLPFSVFLLHFTIHFLIVEWPTLVHEIKSASSLLIYICKHTFLKSLLLIVRWNLRKNCCLECFHLLVGRLVNQPVFLSPCFLTLNTQNRSAL